MFFIFILVIFSWRAWLAGFILFWLFDLVGDTPTNKHTHLHTHIHALRHIYTHTSIYIYTHPYKHANIHVYIHTNRCTFVYTSTYTHARTHMCKHVKQYILFASFSSYSFSYNLSSLYVFPSLSFSLFFPSH